MQILTPGTPKPPAPAELEAKVALCPALPSLNSVNEALQELLSAESRLSAQIAEVIRRDPSLTARLLRLVNSVYYGLSTPVNNIEEAVFYLGVRQIRQLTMVTPIIEDFHRMAGGCVFPWREHWQHCLGAAVLTREILGTGEASADESEYVAGLLHDIGKLALAWCFPRHFAEIHTQAAAGKRDLREIEHEILGIDHAEFGARYLECQRLPELMIHVARFHHQPEAAPPPQRIIAGVQIADFMLRNAGIGCSGNYLEVTREQCFAASGWQILFPKSGSTDQAIARASVNRTLERLPTILEGLM